MNTDYKQLVRGMYDAFSRGDAEALLNSVTEDIDWYLPGAAPFSGRRSGREQVRAFFHEVTRLIEDDEFDVDAVLQDGDKVVALGRQRATVRETGQHFEQQWAHVFTIRNGKVAAVHLYEDTHSVASAFGESNKERQTMGGPLGITHPAYSGRSRE